MNRRTLLSSAAAAAGLSVAGRQAARAAMPKMKTYKGIAKRFRVTATGKLKRKQAGKKHLNSHTSGKRKRQLYGYDDKNG